MLITSVLVVLLGIGFLVGRLLVEQRRTEIPDEALEPDIAQRIEKFHRVKVEDGRTVWELRAEKADFLEANGRIVVEQPEVSFFASDGQSVVVSGKRGDVTVNGSEVGRIDLTGGIEVQVGQYMLHTPEASWIDEMDSIVASSGVDISGGAISVKGKVMIVEVGSRRVRVVGGVQTTLRAHELRNETTEAAAPAGPSATATASEKSDAAAQ